MKWSTIGVLLAASLWVLACSDSTLDEAQPEETSEQGSDTLDDDSAGSTASGETSSGEGMLDGDCPQARTFSISKHHGAPEDLSSSNSACDVPGGPFLGRGNGIPHYTFVQTTPNALTAANHAYQIPLNPEIADAPTDIPLLGFVGVAVNGAPFFGPNEGGIPQAEQFGDPIYNNDNASASADGSGTLMDGCLGHTANEYHYHALLDICLTPDSLTEDPWFLPERDTTLPSPVVGYAADGFPVYGRYGAWTSTVRKWWSLRVAGT